MRQKSSEVIVSRPPVTISNMAWMLIGGTSSSEIEPAYRTSRCYNVEDSTLWFMA